MINKIKEFLKPTWQKGFLTVVFFIAFIAIQIYQSLSLRCINEPNGIQACLTADERINYLINSVITNWYMYAIALIGIYILVCIIILLWNHFLGWKKPEFLPSEKVMDSARKALKLETIQGIEPVKMEGPDGRIYWSFRYGTKEILIDEKTEKIVKKQI